MVSSQIIIKLNNDDSISKILSYLKGTQDISIPITLPRRANTKSKHARSKKEERITYKTTVQQN